MTRMEAERMVSERNAKRSRWHYYADCANGNWYVMRSFGHIREMEAV